MTGEHYAVYNHAGVLVAETETYEQARGERPPGGSITFIPG